MLARGGVLPVEPRLCYVLGAGLDVIAVQHVCVAPLSIADVGLVLVVVVSVGSG